MCNCNSGSLDVYIDENTIDEYNRILKKFKEDKEDR